MQQPPNSNPRSTSYLNPSLYNQPTQYNQGQFQPPPYPQYYNPISQPPRTPDRPLNQSGFKALMLLRVPLPVWLIVLFTGLIFYVGFIGALVVHAPKDLTNILGGQTPTPVTNIQAVIPTEVPTPTLTPTPTVKPTPTHTPKWSTAFTFNGNGTKKTTVFTVPDNWKIIWSCNPSSSYLGEYNVIVGVKGSDGSDIDPAAVNTICKAGNTGDSTQEYQGGDVYFDVNSEGAWTIQVQVLK